MIGVGASNIKDTLASFSSKGPTQNGTLKPDVTAPGVDILSAYNTGDSAYATMSGTSMAAPHAAGTIALMIQRDWDLNFSQVAQALDNSTQKHVTAIHRNCSGINGHHIPNDGFGYGRINAVNAQISGRSLDPHPHHHSKPLAPRPPPPRPLKGCNASAPIPQDKCVGSFEISQWLAHKPCDMKWDMDWEGTGATACIHCADKHYRTTIDSCPYFRCGSHYVCGNATVDRKSLGMTLSPRQMKCLYVIKNNTKCGVHKV